MKEFSLAGTKRAEAGKKAAKQLRAQGLIPCNLLTKEGAVSFTVKATDLRNLIYTSQVYAINLNIDGEECKAILKEAQFGPINEEIYHLDFQKFNADEPIVVNIPERLIVDVTPIEIGKTLNVAALSYDNLEIMNAKSVIVAGVKATRASRNK